VWQLKFDPNTQTIVPPTTLGATPADQTRQLATLGTGRPFAVVFGPDQMVYVSQLKSGDIVRIDPTAATPTAVTVARTSDGQGVKGLAFVGEDLYVAQGAAVSKVANLRACSATAPCTAAVTPFLVTAPSAFAADPTTGVLYAADTPVAPGPSVLRRFKLSTNTQDVLATSGNLPDGTSSPLSTVGAAWVDQTLGLIVGDLGPNGLGRLWTVPAVP
jgi:hypothetical protein